MYYIIETNYVGPNQDQDQYLDAHKIEISTSPAITNMSHEVCTEGWCGTTNDWAVFAHGEYATIEEARAAIAETFGKVRDANGDRFVSYDGDVVETYKPGKYEPMSSEATEDWAYEGIQADITDETTDERIAELVAEYEAVANSDGYTLDGDLERFMEERRQELREERFDQFSAQHGEAEFKGTMYALTRQPELSNRVFSGWWGDVSAGEEYTAEWSAPAVTEDGCKYVLRWQFSEIKGAERDADSLDWGVANEAVSA